MVGLKLGNVSGSIPDRNAPIGEVKTLGLKVVGTATTGGLNVSRKLLHLLCYFVFVCFFSGSGICAPFEAHDRSWEGMSEFEALASVLLGRERLVVAPTLDHAALKPEDAVILVHPDRAPKVDSLARFMRDGGRVVLLDDYGSGDALLRHFGMTRLPAPRPPSRMLGQNPDLPIAEPASAHPTVVDVPSVALNHPTALKHPDLSPVLEVRDTRGGKHTVAVAGAVARGRLLVVADGSVFINEMMQLPGNREFAKGVVTYATDSDAWGKREGRVFLLSGTFEETGSYGKEPSALSDLADKLSHGMDAVHEMQRDGLPKTGLYALAIALSSIVLWWASKHAWRTHRYRSPQYLQGSRALYEARAAFLANPSTPRALLMLEWRDALECALKLSLNLRDLPSPETLSTKVAETHGEHLGRELRSVLAVLARAETSVLSKGGPVRYKDQEIHQTGARVRNLVKALREHERTIE